MVTYWDPQPTYRGFLIHRTSPQPPIPTRAFDWTWAHEESASDGPDCLGWGHAASPADCRTAIDEWWDDQEDAEESSTTTACNECFELEETCRECRLTAAFEAYRETY